jgi:hypothetical protein
MNAKYFFIAMSLAGLILIFASCEIDKQSTDSSSNGYSEYQDNADGSEYLIAALDELESIAGLSSTKIGTDCISINTTGFDRKLRPAKSSADTVIVYGSLTTDGYGATITERVTHPKGLLLITVSKSYGKPNGHTVTDVKKYSSYDDFAADIPQSTSITEVYGLSKDTIVTHVTKNGTSETYTFRLPVVTRTINAQDGSISISSRYGLDSMVVTEVKNGVTNIVSTLRNSYGLSDGSLISRIEYADSTWRQVRTLGHSDGSILKEVTTSN